jgi:hypothetical protein
LGAFDSNRNLIYTAATKIYARGSKGSYDLVAADLSFAGGSGRPVQTLSVLPNLLRAKRWHFVAIR